MLSSTSQIQPIQTNTYQIVNNSTASSISYMGQKDLKPSNNQNRPMSCRNSWAHFFSSPLEIQFCRIKASSQTTRTRAIKPGCRVSSRMDGFTWSLVYSYHSFSIGVLLYGQIFGKWDESESTMSLPHEYIVHSVLICNTGDWFCCTFLSSVALVVWTEKPRLISSTKQHSCSPAETIEAD